MTLKEAKQILKQITPAKKRDAILRDGAAWLRQYPAGCTEKLDYNKISEAHVTYYQKGKTS